jgi:hypothetical protein
MLRSVTVLGAGLGMVFPFLGGLFLGRIFGKVLLWLFRLAARLREDTHHERP